MVDFKASKVNSTPSTPDSDTVYLVKKGSNVELLTSDNSGSALYPLNTGYHKYLFNDVLNLRRPAVGQYGSNIFGLSSESFAGSEQSQATVLGLYPFFVLEDISIDRVGFQYIVAGSGVVRLSVYRQDSDRLTRLCNATLTPSGTGIYEATVTTTALKKTELYYFGLSTDQFSNNEFRAFYSNLFFTDVRTSPPSLTDSPCNRLQLTIAYQQSHPSEILFTSISAINGTYTRTTPYLFYRVASIDE